MNPRAEVSALSRNRLPYVSDEDDTNGYASSDSNNRVIFAECGSSILVDSRQEPETLYPGMSTIDGHPLRPQGYHVCVGSKTKWKAITDDLEQYDTEPPD